MVYVLFLGRALENPAVVSPSDDSSLQADNDAKIIKNSKSLCNESLSVSTQDILDHTEAVHYLNLEDL